MKLARVIIKNFKGLKDAVFEPSSFTCLVGENNAGKSSVLQAVVAALNRPSKLADSLYYDFLVPIEFTLDFEDIDQTDLDRLADAEQRERTEEILSNGKLTLLVRYKRGEGPELRVIRLLPKNIGLRDASLKELFKGKKGKDLTDAIAGVIGDSAISVPSFSTQKEAFAFVEQYLNSCAPDKFEQGEAPLPTGIPASITLLLPEPIYIPAVKNLNDDLKTTQTTSFGKLIGLLLEDLNPDLSQFQQSMDQLKAILNRVTVDGSVTDGRHEKVKYLEKQIEKNLSENFPMMKIELEIPPPDLKTVLSAAQIFVNDGSKDLIDNKGDGVKRSLTFSILRTFVQEQEKRKAEGDGRSSVRPLLMLFEEPELYLHPRSQKILFMALGKLAQIHQVVVTTHSPLFFAPGMTASFVRVAKQDGQPKPVGQLFKIDFSLDKIQADIFKLARFENADAAFFSNKAVLFEGGSDDFFVRHIATILNEKWNFDIENISLVRVDGKGNFSKYRRFFETFNIKIFIVADLDAFFEGFDHLGASDKIKQLRVRALEELDNLIIKKPITVVPPATRQIKKRIENTTWRARYDKIRQTLQLGINTVITAELAQEVENLFAWEEDHKRLEAVKTDSEALKIIEPVLTELQLEGIFILRKGQLEDYYPEDVLKFPSKPQRAIAATEQIQSREIFVKLSPGVGANRSEFDDILEKIFK